MSRIDAALGEGKKHVMTEREARASLREADRVEDDANPEDYFVGGKFVSKLLGDAILSELPIKTLAGESFYYEGGFYHPGADEKIAALVAGRLGDAFKKHHLSEVVAYVKATTGISPEALKHGFICLENGLLNPLTGEFRPHTPDVFCLKQMPVEYAPDADCPTFKEKLAEKVDLDVMLTFQEFGGYCLTPGQRFEKALLLYGPPRTMKSTALYALSLVLGKDNMTASTLHQLTEDRFAPAYLFGVMANIAPDISGKELKETAFFMALVGGDSVTYAKKNGHPMTFRPDCKLIFSCNAIPGTTNKNMAFYRRWLLLPFKRQHDAVISELKEQIAAEAPGLLNWFISGLRRLMENDGFTMRPSDEEVKDLYERGSDSITSFIYREIEDDDDASITKQDVFKAYSCYCKQNDLTPENIIKFGRMFKEITGCGTGKKGVRPAYTGVSLKGSRDGAKKGDLSGFTDGDGEDD